MRKHSRSIRSGLAIVLSGLWAIDIARAVTVENESTIFVTVEAIDTRRGEVDVRDRDLRSYRIEVPKEVIDLSKVKVGDRLKMRYRSSVALAITRKKPRANDDDDSDEAKSSHDSGLVTGGSSSTLVTIQSVNPSSHSVAYKDADGFSRNMTVKDPKLQKVVATLKPGDQVEITFTDAVALSIDRE